MNKVQIIRTPHGERLAVLPVEEYEALLEAATDTTTAEEEEALASEMRRLRELDRGEALPIESFRRILAGESPIRVWREHRGLSAAELAERGTSRWMTCPPSRADKDFLRTRFRPSPRRSASGRPNLSSKR